VTLVSFVRPEDTLNAVSHLRSICAYVHTAPIHRSRRGNLQAAVKGLATGLPMLIARDEMAAMATLLRHMAAGFDVIHADQISMAAYALQAARARQNQPRLLLDAHHAVHHLARRMAAVERQPLSWLVMLREARAYARYEAAVCRAYDAVLTVSEEDRTHLLSLFSRRDRPVQEAKFHVVPIGVDPERTAPVRNGHASLAAGAPTILHLGTLLWPPNVKGVLWFARQILPLVWEQVPQARFLVVGKAPPPAVRSLAADPRIVVTGYVADPRMYVEQASTCVVPLLAGSGMRVKILDAWLSGVPVVSTRVGAEGVEVCEGENILLADQAPELAAATVRVLTDPALNASLRSAGRAWVEERYSYRSVYPRVDAVYEHLVNA
jgi:glycosyltransferase involved in cell wall biosynthesis